MRVVSFVMVTLLTVAVPLDTRAAQCPGQAVYVNAETGSDDDVSTDPSRGCDVSKPLRTLVHVADRVRPGGNVMLIGGDVQLVPGFGEVRVMHASCSRWATVPTEPCLNLAGVRGVPLRPIGVRPYDATRPLLVLAQHDLLPNGERPRWHLVPNAEWEPNWGPGRIGVVGEFRATRLIPISYAEEGLFLRVIAAVSPLASDAFFGSGKPRRYLHLAHYRHVEDLRATNQRAAPTLCGPLDPLGPAPREGYIKVLQRDSGAPLAECSLGAPARWRLATYIGPGLHAQKEGDEGFRLYARFASTSNGVLGLGDYVAPGPLGYADPRQVPLLLAFSRFGQAFSVGASSHVSVSGLTRGMSFWGGAEAIRLAETGSHLGLDRVQAYGGVVPLRVGSSYTSISRVEASGGLPDWLYRNDIKDSDHPAPGSGAALAVGNAAYDVRIGSSTFRSSLDGVILDGDQVDFVDNLVEDIRDDAVLSRPSPIARGAVRQSRFRRFYSAIALRTRDNDTCQASCSQSCPVCPNGAPCTCVATCTKLECISKAQNLDLTVIGNHFDLRRGAAENRPWIKLPTGLPAGANPSVFSSTAIFQNGSGEGSHFSFTFIHNTVVAHNVHRCRYDDKLFEPTCNVEGRPLLTAFKHALGVGERMTVLNNIFYVGTLPTMSTTDGAEIAVLRSAPDERYESQGNIYFRSGLPARMGPLFSALEPNPLRFDCHAGQTYDLWREDPLFLSSGARLERYSDRWLCADPRIDTASGDGFFRLLPGPGPARGAVRPIPARYRGFLRCPSVGCNVGAWQ